MTEVTQFVESTIASHKIVVFSKSRCPFCRATKDYFANNFPDETVHVIEIENRPDMSAIQTYLGQKTGETSVPRTFINGNSIGGNSDLQAMLKERVAEMIATSS